MDDPREWDVDTGLDRPEACSRDLRKYFYMVGAAALVILLGTFWYTQYYSKGLGFAPRAATAGPAGGSMVAVNWFPHPSDNTMQTGRSSAKGDFSSIAMALRNSVVSISSVSGTRAQNQAEQAAEQPKGAIGFANPFSGRSVNNIGSGVIVRNDGYIVTNYHIVRGAGTVTVVVFNDLGTERYRADVVKMDESLDLALLKIRPKMPLGAAVLGDSDRVRVAEEVITIGSPFGLDQTVSRGIVSALRKSLVIEKVTHASLIQTDAAINQGNSGGPLVSTEGHVIGINVAIYTPTGAFSGIGFSIPSNQVRRFVGEEISTMPGGQPMVRGQLAAMPSQAAGAVGNAGPAIVSGTASPHTDGRETMVCENCHQVIAKAGGGGGRLANFNYQFTEPPATLSMNVAGTAVAGGGGPGAGFTVMGAGLLPIDAALADRLGHPQGKGVFVGNVVAGSPTALAGLKPGDIILKVDGQRVAIPGQLAAMLTGFGNGEVARLGVMRDGNRRNLDLTLAILPPTARPRAAAAAPKPAPTEFAWQGMEIENFIRVDPLDNPGGEAMRGAEIGEIARGSAAAEVGLQANDVILEINHLSAGTAAMLDRAIRSADGQTSNLLWMMRKGREFYVVLP